MLLLVGGRLATLPGFQPVAPPRNKGHRYLADPPTVEEIVAVMRAAGDGRHGRRLRGLIVVPWRAGANPRGAGTQRIRPRPAARLAARAARQGRAPPRRRHGRVGMGAAAALA